MEIFAILTKYEPEININREFEGLILKTSIFDRFVMVALGIYDVKVYLEHTSSYEDKIRLLTRYFEIFTRKIDEGNVVKAYDLLEKEAKETKSTKLFIEGFREVFPYSQQHLVSYYKGKFESLTKEYFGIVDPQSKILSIEDWIILSMKAPKIK